MSKAKLAVKHMQENLPYTRPANVPLYERKQVYLYVYLFPASSSPSAVPFSLICRRRPRFRITLIRSPFLPPRYATFLVPLEFNKLDLKDYLKRLYNVDTLKIRSYVEQQRITRESKSPLGIAGPIRRPKSKKRMIVELVEPFVWPPAPEDSSPYVIIYDLYLPPPLSPSFKYEECDD